MQTVVRKWGNSLALRLPRQMVADLHLKDGAKVSLSLEEGTLIVKPARRRYRLEELLSGMSEEKRHPETDWGPPRGKEAW